MAERRLALLFGGQWIAQAERNAKERQAILCITVDARELLNQFSQYKCKCPISEALSCGIQAGKSPCCQR